MRHPLDEVAAQRTAVRRWSPEAQEGYVPDTLLGGYCESDAVYRARILRLIEDDGPEASS